MPLLVEFINILTYVHFSVLGGEQGKESRQEARVVHEVHAALYHRRQDPHVRQKPSFR